MTQTYNNLAETRLGGGVLSPCVFRCSSIFSTARRFLSLPVACGDARAIGHNNDVAKRRFVYKQVRG